MVELTFSSEDRVAIYERVSTADQDLETQRGVLREWTADHGLDYDDVVDDGDRFVDFARSGTDTEREAFNDLVDELETGTYDAVVTWEISRIARLGLAYSRFMHAASENDVVVSIASGPVEHVLPDGTGKLIADIMAAIYENELRDLIRRMEAGQERALREGKWVGNVPAGFRVRDGYLEVRHEADPRLDEDEDALTYWQVRAALKQVLVDDESYTAATEGIDLTYQSLANYVDDDRLLERYLAAHDLEDDRIDEALEDVPAAEWWDGDVVQEESDELDERIRSVVREELEN
jgi:DNA invertase Pin-like site-specific DNA recombinase